MKKAYRVPRTTFRAQAGLIFGTKYAVRSTLATGNILPLAVIMMLIILMAGIGIGIVVLEGVQRAQQADQAVAAYYMSDSGVERQLYEIRRNNQTLSYVSGLGGTYFNGGTWQSSSGLEQPLSKQISKVATTSFAVLDLFNPDNIATPVNIDSMGLTWSKDPTCSLPNSRMEVSYAQWDVSLGVPVFPTSFTVLNKDSSGSMTVPLSSTVNYRIRLKAYDCPAVNVTAIFSRLGTQVAYPGDITLSAEGTYGKATQKIMVTMPKLDVLSGVFGYVLFSECTLVKGTGGVVCP